MSFDFFSVWGWMALGVLLVILEMFAPGVIFVWVGVAAIIVGIVVAILPSIPWEIQAVLFALLSVVTMVGGRWYLKRNPLETEDTLLNRRAEQYVDRVFVLDQPIENGFGKVTVDDSTWKIKGADLPAGSKVRVVGADNTILNVEAED